MSNTNTQYTAAQIANMEHLKPKNVLRAFSPAISAQEIMERAALMQDAKCTSSRVQTLNARWA